MRAEPLSPAELLDAASACRRRPPVAASVHLAAIGLGERSLEACAHLPIGERDRALTAMRAAMFGRQLDLGGACPRCGTQLDVTLSTDALRIEPDPQADPRVRIGGREFGVRPVDSADLALAAEVPEEMGRELLALCCLVPADGGGVPEWLSAEAVDAVGEALAAVDPAADPYVALTCFECGTEWDAPIDIGRVLGAEIEAAADALMDDIHDLASAYHWTEETILAMSADRRAGYLLRLRG